MGTIVDGVAKAKKMEPKLLDTVKGITRSLLHTAVAPHPHIVAPARRKPNQGNAPSLTRAVGYEQTKLNRPIADT